MAVNPPSKSIMVATIVAAVVGIALIVPLSLKSDKSAASSGGADAADIRIQPVAKVRNAKRPLRRRGRSRDGPTVYNTICGAARNSGAANSPKAGDKGAWGSPHRPGQRGPLQERFERQECDAARGGAADLSDAEVKAAVDHLVGLAK